jgi:hypothetical protein
MPARIALVVDARTGSDADGEKRDEQQKLSCYPFEGGLS